MEVINLTPHEIVVQPRRGGITTIPRSGTIARLDQPTVEAMSVVINGVTVPIYTRLPGTVVLYDDSTKEVVGVQLPAPKEGTLFLVSSIVKSTAPERRDVIAPDSGGGTRNRDGEVISVSRFMV